METTTATTETEAKAIEELEETAKRAEERREKKRKQRETKKQKKKAAAAEAPKVGTAFENDKDIYVSGLPRDMERSEFVAFFSKCGVLRKDDQGEARVKLYRAPDGSLKGDGVVSYFKRESVDLAFKILDGVEIRPGFPVKLSKAVYEIKAGVKPPPKKAKPDGTTAVKGYDQSKELDWEEEGNNHVVLRGMFTIEEAVESPTFVREMKEDVAAEAGKSGNVESVAVFETNPEGVVVVKFADIASAERCIRAMDGRFFAGRRIHAEYYDGHTNFKVAETEEQKQHRLARWQKFLDESSTQDDAPKP